MIIRKPFEVNKEWEDFYKIKLIETSHFNYSLNNKELNNFGYRQLFLDNKKGCLLYCSNINTDEAVNKSMMEKYNPSLVYHHPGRGGAFGDSLGWISFICRLSEASKQTIKVSCLPLICNNIYNNILKTTGTFQTDNSDKFFVLPGGTKGGYREVYSRLFLPAKMNWVENKSKIVGVQFGKRGLMDRRIQDPKDEERIVKALENKGYVVKFIGGNLGDNACMRIASECQFFVGTCSGMSHLCHSVGTPVHMLTNDRSLERVSAGHVKNTRSKYPTIFWQHPSHFIEYVNNNL